MLKRVVSSSRAAACAFMVSASLVAAGPAFAQDADGPVEEVKFGLLPGLALYLPLWLAEDKGYFEEERVEPVYVNFGGGGAQTMAALLGGSFDMTDLSLQATALANEKGRDLRMIAGNHVDLAYALVLRSDIEEPKASDGFPEVIQDLRGRKVAVTSIGSSTYLVLQKLLERAGMALDDVEVVQVGNAAVAPMVAKQIDAAITIEPNISILVDQLGEGRIILDLRDPEEADSAGLKGMIYDIWVAKADVAKEDRVIRATRALAKGVETVKDPSTDVEYMMGLLRANLPLEDVSDEVLRSQVKSMLSGFHTEIPPERVRRSAEILGLDVPEYESIVAGVALVKE